MKKKQGFTLIELLVVIAIIGILSSVVLASLSTARSKGSNAAIKSQLSSMRAEAEISGQSPNINYTDVCATSPESAAHKLFAAAVNSAGVAEDEGAYCNSDQNSYVAAVTLKSAEGTTLGWCVDSTGVSKGVTDAVNDANYMTATACGN